MELFDNNMSFLEFKKTFSTEDVCYSYLESIYWSKRVVSPYHKRAQVSQVQKNVYKCKNTGKMFTVRTNTLFDDEVSLKLWFNALYILIKDPDIPVEHLGGLLGIDTASAEYFRLRIEDYSKS